MRTLSLLVYVVTVVSSFCFGQEPREVALPDKNQEVSFTTDVLPILQKNCQACHNKSETEGELILESASSLLEGGDSGPAVIPGKSDESLIFQLASHRAEPIMPPLDNDVGAKPLSPKALGLLKAWIDQGAKSGPSEPVADITWRKVPASYAQVFALELSPDGRFLAAGRGNELIVYSVPAQREIQRLVDPAISQTHPKSAHLDVVQSLAWSPDQNTIVSGGYRCIKVWRRSAPAEAPGKDTDAKAPGKLGELIDFVVSSDETRGVALVAGEHGNVAKLVELPSHTVLKEITIDVFSFDHLLSLDRQAGLRRERLRVANEDVEVAKKRKDDDEQNAKKSEAELKKAEEEVPKRKEALVKAEENTKSKQSQLEPIEEAVAKDKARIDQIDQALAAASEQEKPKLTAERLQLVETLNKNEAQLKAIREELKKLQDEEEKKRQEFEGAEKVVTLAKEAIERAKKAVELRTQELTDAEAEAEEYRRRAKEAEELAAREKQKATEAQHDLVSVCLLSGPWRFGLRDDLGRLAVLAFESGELISVHENAASQDPEWRLVKTIGYPDEPQLFADRVTSLAFSHDGTMLATGGGEPSRSGEVQLWSTSDWAHIASIDNAHSDVVYDLEFSPQNDMLASCGSDRMMKVVDPVRAKLIRNFEGHTGHVLGVAWRADGRTLATAGADKVVKLWDAKEGTQKKTVSGFKTEITAVRFLGLEDRFVFSMGDGKVESRDSGGNGKPGFEGFSDYVHNVSSSRDGKVVAAAGQDRVIRVWDAAGKLMVEFK